MSSPRAAGMVTTPGRGRRGLATIVAIVFIDLLGFGIIIPILPFYVRSFGVSDVYIGLLAAAYSLTQFVLAPILGRLSDEYGRRPVLMASTFGNAVAWAIFGVAAELEPVVGLGGALVALFGARMLAGAMGGNVATAQAYVADVTPVERRAGALGLVGAAFGLGFVFGPALGGFFASDAVVSAADAWLPAPIPATPYSLPSFAAAGLSLLAALATARYLVEPPRAQAGATPTLIGGLLESLRDDSMRRLVVAFLLISIGFSGIQVMFIPYVADRYGLAETGAAALLTYVGVLGVVNQGVVVGRLTRIVRTATVAVAGAILLTLALALLPFSPDIGLALSAVGIPPSIGPLAVLLAVLGLLSVGFGWVNVTIATLVSTAATAEAQGRAFGVTQGAGSLGRVVGPPAMAALYVAAYWSPFVAGAGLAALVVLLLVAVRAVPDGHEPRPSTPR